MKLRLAFALVLLALAGCSAYTRALDRGDELAKQEQWEAAEAAYEEAAKADPKRPEAKLRLSHVRNKRAESWLSKARAAREALRLDDALSAFAEAARIVPDNPEVTRAFEAALEERLQFAEGDLGKGALESAERHLNAYLAYRPSSRPGALLRSQLQSAYAQRSFATAEDFEKKGKLGNALVEYLRADEQKVGATAARERAELVRRKLREELTWFVEAVPVIDKTNSQDIAQRLGAGRLGQSFGDKLPISVVTLAPEDGRGVRLSLSLDRVLFNREKSSIQRTQRYLATMKSVQNPERAKSEQKLLAAERKQEEIDEAFAAALRRYTDAQNAVDRARDAADRCVGEAISACQRALDDCKSEAASMVKAAAATRPESGGQSVGVPCQRLECTGGDCGALKDTVLTAEREQGGRRVELEKAATAVDRQRREIQRLRDLVYRTPLTIEEPVYSDFVYDIDVHTLKGRAVVTLELDPLKATPSRAPFTQDYVVSKSDETHKGYDRYGILVDPLVMPNELEVRIELGEKALADVVSRVRARFDLYRDGFVQDARRSIVRASAEDAVETAVRAILVSADAPPEDVVAALAQARSLKQPLSIVSQ